MKEYFEVKITLGKLVKILLVSLIVYSFSTGYECGFFPLSECNYPKPIQSVFRLSFSIISLAGIFTIIMSNLDEGFTFKLKNPFYSQADSEAWEEYQQWLKERENNKY